MSAVSEATQLLVGLSGGDRSGVSRLMELVRDEVRALAGRYVSRPDPLTPLQPTELVREAFTNLVDDDHTDWRSRSHFYAVGATAMRRILVDEARKRISRNRDGRPLQLPLAKELTISFERDGDLVALDDVLQRLAQTNPARERLVELRFFGGMSVEEVAEVTGADERELEREWRVTRAWLRRELSTH